MLQEKKQFVEADSGGDFDSAPTKVGPNSWINMENCRTLTTDAGEVGNVESIGSTILISNPALPAGTNYRIGSPVDEAKSRIIYFIWNSNGDHCIFVYFPRTAALLPMLLNSQVTGGLGFDKNSLIHSAVVINGCVYWTDFLNEPRRVDIDAGLKMNNPSYVTNVLPYTNPLSQSVIAWIRRQPGLPPIATKITQTSPALVYNFIAKEAFLFQYRYQYRNFEFSTLSADSLLVDFNADGETFNRIDITIPLGEQIDQDVIRIDVVATYLQSGISFIIYSFIASQISAAIAAHNSGTIALKVIFYNDQIGIALDSAYAAKPFDSVPIRCETISAAKNRSFQGNYVIGYGTPSTSSLTAIPVTQSQGGGGGVIGEWFLIDLIYVPNDDPTEQVFSAYIIKLNTLSPAPGYYAPFVLFPINPTFGPPFPASVDFSIMNYLGSDAPTATAVLAEAAASPDGLMSYSMLDLIDQNTSVNITGAPGSIPGLVNQIVVKSDDYYELAVNFLDNAGRKCGVAPSVKVQIPDRVYNQLTYYAYIQWALSNVNAITEIPDWAFYFSVNITKSLRTRFFIQARGRNITYATKDADNVYTFNTAAYALTNAGIAIDISTIFPLGLGYVFSDGDIMKIYRPTATYVVSVIAQVGQWVIGQLADLGTIGNTSSLVADFIFELYTPYQLQANEPYYEVSQIYKITNPTLSTRTYSIITGQIEGDTHLIARTDIFGQYLAEAMSSNDKFYKLWFTDVGRPNFIDIIGQTEKQDTVAFSNTFIQGSQNNGLSTYNALDTKDVFPECGAIRKLQLTSKVEGEQGSVMLGVCEEETASMYLSESQLLSTNTNADIAISNEVIGTINVLKGNFGTVNPESVVEFRGNIFYYDALNGKFIQYSSNGLFPISSYKMTRYWKLFSDQYLSMTQAEIEALGSRPFVFTAVDPHNWELLVSVPKLLTAPPKGYLPDYTDMIYPFDIWDGQAKALVFKLAAQPNHWSGAYNITAEGFAVVNNQVYAFKNGQIWQMNSEETFGNFFGVQYKSRIMFVGNQAPNRPKVYNNISVESNLIPSLTYFRTEPTLAEFDEFDLYEQASDLVDFNYEVKEGQLYSFIYRNKLVPTAEGLTFDGLLTAEKIRALTLKVLLEFQTTNNPVELRAVNLGFQVSAGHTT